MWYQIENEMTRMKSKFQIDHVGRVGNGNLSEENKTIIFQS